MTELSEAKSILIVDNDIDIRSRMSDFLRGQNHKVLEARDGAEALKMAENMQFNLVITELDLPGIDGKELIGKLKSLHKDFKPKSILVVSASVDADSLKSGTSKRIGTTSALFT